MKRLVCLLAILALTVPAMAGSVDVTVMDNGNGTITISYAATDATVRGIGLQVDLDMALETGADQGGTDTSLNTPIDAYAGDTPLVDLATITECEGLTTVGTTVLADPAVAGGIADTAGLTSVAICVGALDCTANQGGAAASGTIVTLAVPCGATVTVTEDDERGGVVGDGVDAVNITNLAGPTTCGPECWSWPCFELGDGNMDGIVDGLDFDILLPAFNKVDGVDEEYDPCADFNKDGIVDGLDFDIMLPNFNQVCPS